VCLVSPRVCLVSPSGCVWYHPPSYVQRNFLVGTWLRREHPRGVSQISGVSGITQGVSGITHPALESSHPNNRITIIYIYFIYIYHTTQISYSLYIWLVVGSWWAAACYIYIYIYICAASPRNSSSVKGVQQVPRKTQTWKEAHRKREGRKHRCHLCNAQLSKTCIATLKVTCVMLAP
jgi:hypothetical protein